MKKSTLTRYISNILWNHSVWYVHSFRCWRRRFRNTRRTTEQSKHKHTKNLGVRFVILAQLTKSILPFSRMTNHNQLFIVKHVAIRTPEVQKNQNCHPVQLRFFSEQLYANWPFYSKQIYPFTKAFSNQRNSLLNPKYQTRFLPRFPSRPFLRRGTVIFPPNTTCLAIQI